MVAIKTKAREEAEPAQDSLARIASRQPAASPVQRPWGIADVQQGAGNLAMQNLLRSGAMQAKLTVSQPGDIYEQEADRMADQVTSSAPMPIIHRKCAACEAGGATCPKCEEEEKVRRKEKPGPASQTTSAIHPQSAALRGGGQPLPQSVRAFFEPHFGHDFSQVRVHTDTKAAESARAVNALAYTVGRDVVFSAGQYSPRTTEG